MVLKFIKLKQKTLKLYHCSNSSTCPLCLRNVSKNFSTDNMEEAGFYGHVYDFSVDYDAITIDILYYIRHLQVFNGRAWYGINRMFRFMKHIYVTAMTFFSCNALKCVSMNNQECKARPEIIDINSDGPSFYFVLIVFL